MRILILILGLISFYACSTKAKKKNYIGFKVEAKWLNDTVPNGKAIFYNANGTIHSIQFYQRGLRNGPSTYFNNEGIITDSVNYYNGFKNGYYFKYSDEGMLIQKNYYLRGFFIGPKLTYHKNKLTFFEFITFEQQSPFYCIYKDDSLIVEGKPFFASSYEVIADNGNEGFGIFGYLVHAPKLVTDFSLIMKQPKVADYITIRHYSEDEFLIDTILTPKYGEKVYLRAYFKDSINNKEHIYMTDLN